MARFVMRSLKFSLVAAIALSSPFAAAQAYGAYPGWNGPPGGDFAPEGYPGASRAEQGSPVALLRDSVERLTRFLDRKPDQRALAIYLEQEVAPWFDFDYMAEWAAGRHFRRMDEAQLDELTARLKESFLGKMTQKLARYSRQRAAFLPPQADGPNQVTMPVVIENPGNGYPARLEFHMRQTDKGWKVIDVSANGMSALVFYRQMFNDMLRQGQHMAPPPPMRPY